MKPLVYLACHARGGSTMMQEMLSSPPFSYVFHETYLGSAAATNTITPPDKKCLMEHGLKNPVPQGYRGPIPKVVESLMTLPVKVIGFKEIASPNWQLFAKAYPHTKFICVTRDPRDIYLSKIKLHDMDPFKGFKHISESFAKRFKEWRQMENAGALIVRYEDVCQYPTQSMDLIREYTGLDFPEPKNIGKYLTKIGGKRGDESLRRNFKVDDSSVKNWAESDNPFIPKISEKFDKELRYLNYK